MKRAPGAPRLTKEGVDLDAVERERNRPEEPEYIPVTKELRGALLLAESRRRARLAASELEKILGHEVTDPNHARDVINEARALMAGAVAMLDELR